VIFTKSAVVLSANVGFLAIPGVVLSNLSGTNITSAKEVVIFTSASQIASSLSVEASIGSIVIGLLLVRYNRRKRKEEPAGAVSDTRN
jgi:ABC-type cobalamin transport system permease subunit